AAHCAPVYGSPGVYLSSNRWKMCKLSATYKLRPARPTRFQLLHQCQRVQHGVGGRREEMMLVSTVSGLISMPGIMKMSCATACAFVWSSTRWSNWFSSAYSPVEAVIPPWSMPPQRDFCSDLSR
ncbi:hypothetical protein L915_20576, partial [Phytophthora nicotianae]